MKEGDSMRDIQDYEVKYKDEPCERYQVKYRRKKILELLQLCKHDVVLDACANTLSARVS